MSDTKRQDDIILNNESYSRRNNILFRGFTVTSHYLETCETKVKNILKIMDIKDDFCPCPSLYYTWSVYDSLRDLNFLNQCLITT